MSILIAWYSDTVHRCQEGIYTVQYVCYLSLTMIITLLSGLEVWSESSIMTEVVFLRYRLKRNALYYAGHSFIILQYYDS
jgi:hypothetical protein